MQLTRLDRWLRARFVNGTHVYTLRPPMVLPGGIRHEELPQNAASRFRHRYIARNPKLANELMGSRFNLPDDTVVPLAYAT